MIKVELISSRLLLSSKDVMQPSVVLLPVRYRPWCESLRCHVGLQRICGRGGSPLFLLPQGALVRSPVTDVLCQIHAAGDALSAASEQHTGGTERG